MKNQTKKTIQYRQGDVMIRYVDSLPKKLKPVARVRGRLVLADGASGHSHYIDDPDTEMFTTEDGAHVLKINGSRLKGRWPVIDHSHLKVVVNHPEIGPLAFAEIDAAVKGKVATVDGYFAVLRHDSNPVEHDAIALPNGQAEQLDQSEYHREEIRRVTD